MRDMSAEAQRLLVALDLAEVGVAIQRQNLRRAHPEADPELIDALVAAWLDDRPGARFGDCPGRARVVDVG